MSRMPIYAAAVATLLSTTAMAQQMPPATPSPQPAPSAQTMPPTGTAPGSLAFVNRQRPDQFLASDLIGMTVYGAANETLGEVNDLLVEPTGEVTAAVIGVGGFLGVGQKDVAVPFQMVEKTRNSDGERLVLRKSKDELKAAPTFAKFDAKSSAKSDAAPATTGSLGTARPATTPPTGAR